MTIPVVQGVAVPSSQQQASSSYNQPYVPAPQQPAASNSGFGFGGGGFGGGNDASDPFNPGGDFNGVKGEPQPKQFQDVFFAILFYAHLVVMLIVLAMFSVNSGGGGGDNGYSYGGVATCVSICGAFALGLSTVTLGFMMKFAHELVQAALIFSVIMSLLVGIAGLMMGQMMMGIMGLISFAVGCCYAYFVWGRIPFAAANLNTALTAVRLNMGLAVVAYGFLAVAFGWSLWWSIAASSAFAAVGNGLIFLFLVSYYWVHQVLMNTVHVTVTGVIGTWWFVPHEASTCCSKAVTDSLVRATTYSFGSICFGSLLVAIVQALRALHHMLQDNDEFNFLVCIIDCILACIQGIIEYLNKWAYVYVGLYGYSYLQAGRNVITLFQNKGWTAIITDDLVENVLFMMSVSIGLITGLVGLAMGGIDGDMFAGVGYENGALVGFILGFLVGFLFSSILMSVVGSAVNTVIVCFAESPAEFEANHPQLSAEMRGAWRAAWPTECGNL